MSYYLQAPSGGRGDYQDRAMREASLDSAYEDSTPRASPRPPPRPDPAAHRQRRASFDTMLSFTAASSATSVSTLAAQQNLLSVQQTEVLATVNRLAKSVEALSQNTVDPAQILELTDRLNMMSVNSPINNANTRLSPYPRNQPFVPQNLQSRFNGASRNGPFPAPPAFQHQQRPRPSNIPPQPPLPSIRSTPFPSRSAPPAQAYASPPHVAMRQYPEPTTPWGEPEPVRHILFTGKSNELKRFLVEIRDTIRPHFGRFMTD